MKEDLGSEGGCDILQTFVDAPCDFRSVDGLEFWGGGEDCVYMQYK